MSDIDNKINENINDKKIAIVGISAMDRGVLTFFSASTIACAIGAFMLTPADAKIACIFFAAGSLVLTIGYYRYVKNKNKPTKQEMDNYLKDIIEKDNNKE